jgi:hypothetical protein
MSHGRYSTVKGMEGQSNANVMFQTLTLAVVTRPGNRFVGIWLFRIRLEPIEQMVQKSGKGDPVHRTPFSLGGCCGLFRLTAQSRQW